MDFVKDGYYRCADNPEEEVFIEKPRGDYVEPNYAKPGFVKLPLQCACQQCSHTICAYHPMQRMSPGLPQQTTIPQIEFVRSKPW